MDKLRGTQAEEQKEGQAERQALEVEFDKLRERNRERD